ncbi:MAG: sulfotransferase domain-containing protein [Verrucomicrobiota bacterium]
MLQNRLMLRAKNALRVRVPWLLFGVIRLASKTVFFQKERAYLHGRIKDESGVQSLLFFTTIRCASQRNISVLSRFHESMGGISLDLSKYFFHAGIHVREGTWNLEQSQKYLQPNGFFFGAVPGIPDQFDWSQFKVVVILRDPRDIMVSFFYSLAHAHTPSDAEFANDSREAREEGLEWFVRQKKRLDMVGSECRDRIRRFWNKPGVFCRRYEDMMSSYDGFISDLSDYLELPQEAEGLKQEIIEEQHASAPAGNKEDLLSHRRAGNAGQFREKLSSDAVKFLNMEFADILEVLEYETP